MEGEERGAKNAVCAAGYVGVVQVGERERGRERPGLSRQQDREAEGVRERGGQYVCVCSVCVCVCVRERERERERERCNRVSWAYIKDVLTP